MKYTLQLSPFQIIFNSEMYFLNQDLLNIPFSFSSKFQKKISESIKFLNIDKKNYLTTIKISKLYPKIKRKIIEHLNLFLRDSNLENCLDGVYKYILDLTKIKNQNLCIIDDIIKEQGLNGDLSSLYPSKIPELYLHQAFNTQLLDILAHQVSSLIKSCIDIALRKIKDMNLPKNSSTQITNLLLNPSGDIRENIIKSKLEGKYWTSSRHLALVSNEHMSFNEWEKRYKKKIIPEKDKNRNKGKKILIDKLLLNLPETLIENFQLYTKAIPKLNYYKALDAQIQVRQAYLLKKFLEYFKKDKKFPHDYIFNPKIAKNVIKMLRCFYE